MAINFHNNQHHDSEETLSQELRRMMRNNLNKFLRWLAPNPREPWYIVVLRYFYKIPAVILLVATSPITIAILIFTFIVAF